MHTQDYLVIHTPGAFGNFIGYLVDCHACGTLLPSPFVESGASHKRTGAKTQSWDMVIPGHWQKYNEETTANKTVIGCVWQPRHFPYVLHAYHSRTNQGQYGKCGVEFAEQDFYNFVMNHSASDRMRQALIDLKTFFGIEITAHNTQVPRHVLRMFFWLTLFEQDNNVVTITNQKIRNLNDIVLLDIEEILDYDKLKLFFTKRFSSNLDFRDLHREFLEKNRSLQDYTTANTVIDAVKKNKHMEIGQLSVIGEAFVFYELERHYFDIPFFNMINFFNNTTEILYYIKHYPDCMKQPNKLYCQHHHRFPTPRKQV